MSTTTILYAVANEPTGWFGITATNAAILAAIGTVAAAVATFATLLFARRTISLTKETADATKQTADATREAARATINAVERAHELDQASKREQDVTRKAGIRQLLTIEFEQALGRLQKIRDAANAIGTAHLIGAVNDPVNAPIHHIRMTWLLGLALPPLDRTTWTGLITYIPLDLTEGEIQATTEIFGLWDALNFQLSLARQSFLQAEEMRISHQTSSGREQLHQDQMSLHWRIVSGLIEDIIAKGNPMLPLTE